MANESASEATRLDGVVYFSETIAGLFGYLWSIMTTAKASRLPQPPSATHDELGGGVDDSVCDYGLYGTSRRRDFIFKVL